jgi:hypothetical protein
MEIASAQNCLPILALDSIQHAFEIMVPIILSATVFCCGVYRMMWCLRMPLFYKKVKFMGTKFHTIISMQNLYLSLGLLFYHNLPSLKSIKCIIFMFQKIRKHPS